MIKTQVMNAAWSINSGGRLNKQIAERALFTITTDDTIEDVFFRSKSIKQAFKNKLSNRLSEPADLNSVPSLLTLDFQSAVVAGDSPIRYLELTVVVMDEESDSMLWYFILRSPEVCISPAHLDDIVYLIASRIYPMNKAEKPRYFL
jgi:hypothetical protein